MNTFEPSSMENLVRKVSAKARVQLMQKGITVEPNTDSIYAHYRRAGLTPISDKEMDGLVARVVDDTEMLM